MTTFLLDLWQDLREKRLWPVAVGLLAATVAIPLVLLKPAASPAPAPTVVTDSSQRETLPAVDVDDSPTHGSKLATFAARNPFQPLSDLKKSATNSVPSSAPSGAPAGRPDGGAPSIPGISSASSGGSGAGAPATGSGSGGGSTPPGVNPNGPRVQWFRYTADISFGSPTKMKTLKGLKSFKLLPDDQHPAIVFLGVSDDAKHAIFMVSDPAFRAEGEGKCNSDAICQFVELGLSEDSNEESFTAEDGTTQYNVKLLKLNRESITADQAQGDTTDTKPASKQAAKPASKQGAGGGGATVKEASEDFLPSLLFLPGVARESK